jgi:HEAT repeat protein
MCALVADPLADSWDDLPVLVGRFGFLTAPTPASVTFVLDLEAEARADGFLELADALLYPMGALVRTIEDEDPWTASRLHLRLVDVFEQSSAVDTLVGAAAGLGNAGRTSDRGRLLPLLQHQDGLVRGYAAGSLRRMRTPEVIEALIPMLRDPDRFVASQALHALDRNLLEPDESILLAAVAILEEHHPDIAGILADALGTRVKLDIAVAIALRTMADRTPDVRLRHRIEQILEHAGLP